ncbi:Uncharacterised protein [Streptococcus suis]|uniref:Uncharacterized protein n=1 Tax=Streptococcus suis TaxID=1307 RepID=A0A116L4S7_STRSU|nr:Uncharacterised protein [Streptococcus suis]CYV65039.1 Uncharacterised protein [Streptococcus suis]CYW21311.1 Uncharacterised protein [Streptococcus suis]
MLQTKYSKWLLIHQYLLSVFIPFQSVQEIADNYKKPPYWTVITLLKIEDIVQILSHSRMSEDLCFEVGIRNLIVNRHSNQVNQLL